MTVLPSSFNEQPKPSKQTRSSNKKTKYRIYSIKITVLHRSNRSHITSVHLSSLQNTTFIFCSFRSFSASSSLSAFALALCISSIWASSSLVLCCSVSTRARRSSLAECNWSCWNNHSGKIKKCKLNLCTILHIRYGLYLRNKHRFLSNSLTNSTHTDEPCPS